MKDNPELQLGLPDLVIHSPAKVNLFFEVIGKRPDGYHNIETLAAPLNVADELKFTRTTDPEIQFQLEINESVFKLVRNPSNPEELSVPSDLSNLAFKAALLLKDRYSVEQGIKIELKKNIPPQSGLGAGSSNAAAVLRACNQLWELDLPLSELVAIGAMLGADVPLFFYPGAVIARGIGEQITPMICGVKRQAVIFRPPTGIPTKDVYRRSQPRNPVKSVEDIARYMKQGDWPSFDNSIFNRLEEFAAPLTEWIDVMRTAFIQSGCRGCCLSGSGSTYFGVFDCLEDADRAACRLREEYPGWIQVVEINL